MPNYDPPAGVFQDIPPAGPQMMWWSGYNIRFRLDKIETIGLMVPLKDTSNDQLVLPGPGLYRRVFTTPSTTTGQILFGSNADLRLAEFDPASTPLQGTRWALYNITPAGLPAISDVLTDPSAGRIEIPPVWWFSDQDDVVVGCRAGGTTEPCYSWNRDRTMPFAPLANSPVGAVGGGILNRILTLLGCTSLTEPDPRRFMTIRWSDRYNFTDWTPTDLNLSGELQLEGGSRIVGGGVTGFGVIAWTDKRMAVLTETFDNNVYERRYIDGGRGMLANQSWCEADGQVFWIDENRVLNTFDGGRPRQLINTMKYATLETISDIQAARIYMQPNPEYSEILIWYPEGADGVPNVALVFNYALNAWYPWRLLRTGWCQRFGVIPAIAIDDDNQIWQQDIDIGLDAPWRSIASPFTVQAADVEPFDFEFQSNLVTTEAPAVDTHHRTRVIVDHMKASPAGLAQPDTFSLTLRGFGKTSMNSDYIEETKVYPAGSNEQDFRVGGKALQMTVFGDDVKTLFRFGTFFTKDAKDGER